MITLKQEKIIKKLLSKKGRQTTGLCLVEGKKNLEAAKNFLEFSFTVQDTKNFKKLLSVQTPQPIAGVAKIPQNNLSDLLKRKVIVLLDGVQDPGNVGAILRLCLGFKAALVLIESADPSSPKVIRSSAGAFFAVPWLEIKREEAEETIKKINRLTYRLEAKPKAEFFNDRLLKKFSQETLLIAGSEGEGIKLKTKAPSLMIKHEKELESLNVAQALTIVLARLYNKE
ncbi:MAG: RNA methyltransferase [Patescibacteria group bacterium]|nr:MAG: RNA methyltransferase [Patescibacteria group bacterium]